MSRGYLSGVFVRVMFPVCKKLIVSKEQLDLEYKT